jgi:hypothetical protein
MDIYIEPFYRPIHEAKVGAVMAAYNAVNNTYCSENKILLTDILRGILDFKGFVMSDWWSVYSNHSDSFNSGLDLKSFFRFGSVKSESLFGITLYMSILYSSTLSLLIYTFIESPILIH